MYAATEEDVTTERHNAIQSLRQTNRGAADRRGLAIFDFQGGDSSGEVWIEWLTSDDGFEGGEQRHPLLSEGGEIPAQARERVSAPI